MSEASSAQGELSSSNNHLKLNETQTGNILTSTILDLAFNGFKKSSNFLSKKI